MTAPDNAKRSDKKWRWLLAGLVVLLLALGMVWLVSQPKPAQSPAAPVVQVQREPAGSIGGKVVDDAGHPIVGANIVVDITKRSRDQRISDSPRYKTVKSDADGKWSCDGVPAEFDSCNLGCWHPGYVSTADNDSASWVTTEYRKLDALIAHTAVIILKRGVHVTGLVRGQDGQPLANASIGVGRQRMASAVPEQHTDSTGRFTIAVHPTGKLLVTIRAAGYAPELIEVDPGGSDRSVEVDLKPAATLSGRVVDKQGKPVPQAGVYVDTWRKARTIVTYLKTDDDGRFVWEEAPHDQVLAYVHVKGFARLGLVALETGKDNTLTLTRPTTIHGTVVDDLTGKPVSRFKVIVGIGSEKGDSVSWLPGSREEPPTASKDGTFSTAMTAPYPRQAIRVEAPGYAPADSPVLTIDETDRLLTFRLKKGENIAGTVLDSAGDAVADADVYLALPGSPLSLTDNRPEHRVRIVAQTDAAGHFSLPAQSQTFLLVAVHPKGYAEVKQADLTDTVKLQPWGVIEGQVFRDQKTLPDQELVAHQPDRVYEPAIAWVFRRLKTTTDSSGRFRLEHVPPGKWSVALAVRRGGNISLENGARVEVKAGEVARMRAGSNGRLVVGKVQIPPELAQRQDWAFQDATLAEVFPRLRPKFFGELDGVPQEQVQERADKWLQTDEGKAYSREISRQSLERRFRTILIAKDGSFRADNVDPGDYELRVPVKGITTSTSRPSPATIASGYARFTIPALSLGQADEPVELVPVQLVLHGSIALGQPAPTFNVRTLDGKPFNLADCRGKFVILCFWATWNQSYKLDLSSLKALYKAHAEGDRLVMLSLSVDEDVADAQSFVTRNVLAWPQVYLGGVQEQTVGRLDGIQSYPSYWLLSPEGNVLARDAKMAAIQAELAERLKGQKAVQN